MPCWNGTWHLTRFGRDFFFLISFPIHTVAKYELILPNMRNRRVDVDKLVERSNLEAIVARSSSGILNQMVDIIRIHIVKLDMVVHRLSRCKCKQKQIHLPPKPQPRSSPDGSNNGRPGLGTPTASRKMATRIVEVQGAYSGVVSRLAAWLIDEGIAIVSFAVISLLIESVTKIVKWDDNYKIDPKLLLVVFVAWAIHIRFVSLLIARRTFGMALVGLVLVSREGLRPGFMQIAFRQAIQPIFSMIPVVNWASFLLAWIRSDGRFPHDLLSCTGCVYSWDVRMANLRLQRRKLNGETSETGEENDYFDSIMYP